MRKRYIPLIIGLITVFFGAGLLLFPQLRSSGEKTSGHALAKAPSRAPVPVVTAMVTSEPFTEKLEALGTTKANESVVVTPTVEERVVAILVDDGEFVNKGQVLVKLDDSEAQYLLAEARAALKEQQQQFETMRRLAKTNATSRSQLDEEQGLLEIAVAKVSLLEARLQDYTIRAPFSGTLGIRQISTGPVVEFTFVHITNQLLRMEPLESPEFFLQGPECHHHFLDRRTACPVVQLLRRIGLEQEDPPAPEAGDNVPMHPLSQRGRDMRENRDNGIPAFRRNPVVRQV